jgi:N-acetyl sugar amidotransferase
MEIKKKNVLKLYNLPKKILFCKKCTISNQRPRITFNSKGICSACQYAVFKRKKINWKKREEELLRLLDKHRSKINKHDIVVPCSGGKDGSWVAHQLKFKYGMKPLCVTWSPIIPSKIGKTNLRNFIKLGNFDHILGKPDSKTLKKLTALSLDIMGEPFQPFIYGQYNYPVKIALENNISVLMYGENAEAEYGGDMTFAFKPYNDFQSRNNHFFSKFTPEMWSNYKISKKHLNEFSAPPINKILKNDIRMYFFGYYKFWDPQENFYYCQKHTGFKVNEDRTEGTFSKYASLDDELDGFHYYLMFIKFGIGRATSDAAHEVRDQKISREEAVYLVKKYDGEFPKKFYKTLLKYCNISDSKFQKIIDSWRSDHIWDKINGKWFLKNTVWK